jgi:predicted TIM-barrel fold metal-dependent hydrolase
MAEIWPNAKNLALSNHPPGLTFQDVAGRIPHQAQLAEHVEIKNGEARDLTLVRRAIESMGIDVQVVFPQPMLEIGLHPSAAVEQQLIFAYNRWFTSRILGHDPRIKSMLALPFANPDACLRTIDEFAGKPGVVGFLVTSQRQAELYRPEYMPVYRALEERGLPLGFHAGPDYSVGKHVNRFVSVHSLSFVTCNMIHLTNWIINGLPERFPKLKALGLRRAGENRRPAVPHPAGQAQHPGRERAKSVWVVGCRALRQFCRPQYLSMYCRNDFHSSIVSM